MDVALLFSPGTIEADIALDGVDLLTDHDLESAIIISLFTNRRASNDDVVENGDRQGWWGDTYAEIQGDQIGSRLYLLFREKQTQQVLNRAFQYVTEAVQWLITDKVAESITVNVEIVRMGVLGIGLVVVKPQGTKTFKYQYAWEQL